MVRANLLPAIALLAILAAACGGKDGTAGVIPGTTLRGVSLSPRSFQEPDFTAFFARAREAGGTVAWYGDWAELGVAGKAPDVVAGLAKRFGFQPLYAVGFFNQSTGRLLRPLDAATVDMYRASAAAFAAKHKPAYFGFGVEVNILAEKSPADFEAFVTLFASVYDAVKAVSPQTQVFTVFQLERMKGLHGGLFGGRNDAALAQWALLDRFPNADLIAFTTYPGIVFRDPGEMPDEYYSDLLSRTSKPIAFSEIGWPSELSAQGWQSSEAEQAAFVARFLELTSGLQPRFLIWSFLYDQGLPEPFRGSGLMRPDGSPRPAWDAWIAGR